SRRAPAGGNGTARPCQRPAATVCAHHAGAALVCRARLRAGRPGAAAASQTHAVQSPAQFQCVHESALTHIPRILVEAPLAVGTELTLPAAKAHHLRTVLRLGAGAPLRLFNGDGREYSACLTRAARDQVEVVVEAAA